MALQAAVRLRSGSKALCKCIVILFYIQSINQSIKIILILQTPIAYAEVILTWKVQEFVKGKPRGANPAMVFTMGNPINIYAVNSSKKQSVLLLKKPYLKHYVALPTATPSMRALSRLVNYNSRT